MTCDLIYQWLFNDKKILHFPNLKSLILIEYQKSIEPIFQCLFHLIENQLDELALTFNGIIFTGRRKQKMTMMKKLICQLFSSQCHLTSLRLDISHWFIHDDIHQCLTSDSIQYKHQSFCLTLRRLYLRLRYTRFLEDLIEHVPNLEQISVQFDISLKFDLLWKSNIEIMKQSNENWFNKLPKLRYFSLKTFIEGDCEFIYLKWLLNNLNYVKKLQLYLANYELDIRESQNIWKSFIDANFIRQYCLPDRINNLLDFDFYICSYSQLSLNDIEQTTNSFKNHSFFLAHQWTNVKYFFDPILSCQHIFSCFTNPFHFSRNLIKYPNIINWPHMDNIWYRLHPSLYLVLQGFNQLTPNVSSIKVHASK
ncbi:unnamed protein product [Rotaria sp. Silwood2]|nr:unnamed protein product [Rotaria sp. Silwood2]